MHSQPTVYTSMARIAGRDESVTWRKLFRKQTNCQPFWFQLKLHLSCAYSVLFLASAFSVWFHKFMHNNSRDGSGWLKVERNSIAGKPFLWEMGKCSPPNYPQVFLSLCILLYLKNVSFSLVNFTVFFFFNF